MSVPKNIQHLFAGFNSKHNQDLIYFDNAATTHKPCAVLDAITEFYTANNSNIHRSSHNLGTMATKQYESVRQNICEFISAKKSAEIIFTSGATESINLVAHSYGNSVLTKGDIIIVSGIEHHSNILPWQILAKRCGATIQTMPLNPDLTVDLKNFQKLLNDRVKMVAIHHVSNVTGVLQNIKSIVKRAHLFNVPVFVDGAQAPAHVNVDVTDLNCDFYCFSGHKLFGPTGTGVLFAKTKYLEKMEPYKAGGQMVSKASFENIEWSDLPLKFEAGTPNIAGVIGLGAAVDFLNDHGVNKIIEYEKTLTSHMLSGLNKIPDLIHYGSSKKFAPIFAFNIKNLHHYDIATLLSENNILVRSGHLCNQGLMNHLNIDGCIRASLSFYNNTDEIDVFLSRLVAIIKFLRK